MFNQGISSLGGQLTGLPKQPKAVFINQLDGGYTLNLQGNQHYPTKVAVTLDEVKDIITNFFNTAESVQSDETKTPTSTSTTNPSDDLLAGTIVDKL